MNTVSPGRRLWDFLGSKTLALFLLVAGGIYGLMLAAWGFTSPNEIVVRIASSLPMKLFLLALTANNALCILRTYPLLVKTAALDDSKPTIDFFTRKRNHTAVKVSDDAEKIIPVWRAYFQRRGYRTIVSSDHLALKVTRGHLAPFGTLVFHLSFFLVIAGILISPSTKTEAQMVVAQGDTFSTEQQERLMNVTPPNTENRLPPFGFKVLKIEPRFWKDKLLFTDMRATIQPTGTRTERDVLLTSAWKPDLSTYVTMVGIGHAPLFILSDEKGRELEQAYVNLSTFPPGTEDHFQLETSQYKVFVKVLPDYRLRRGKLTNASLNLRRPGFIVRVVLGRQTVAKGFVKLGQALKINGLNLSFPKVVYWGQFKAQHTPGVLPIWAGFILGVFGLTIRLVFYRKDFTMLVVPKADGSVVHLHGKADYYPKLARRETKRLAEKIKGFSGDKRGEIDGIS